MQSALQMPSIAWRRLAAASLALVTMFTVGVPSASATAGAVNDDAGTDATIVTDEDTPVTISVLSNDTGDGTLTVTEVTNFSNGGSALITDAGTTLLYTPAPNYNGTETFDYTISDGNGGTDTATVTIMVNPVYDPPVASAPAFDDLDGLSAETVAAIETLVDLGITTGTDDTSFSPAMITERWQMALFLTRVLTATGTTLPAVEWSFSDIDGFSADAQTAMNQLAYVGISVGTSTDEFSPAGNVTRQEMALFLVRTLEVSGLTLPTAGANQFTDLSESSVEVQDAVDVLVSLGITTGTTDTTFSPNDELPRWQMALFLARVIEVIQAG